MKPVLPIALLCLPLVLAACGGAPDAPPPPPPPPAPAPPPPPPAPPVPTASVIQAELAPTQGNAAAGTLTLTAVPEGVRVEGTLHGVAAEGTHGFHVHEKGDCSAPDASSAGGHFNPQGHAHGQPGQGEHHAGDMPNLVADANGDLAVDVVVPGVTLGDGGADDILGRAIVLHANADDYVSQPAGDSGPRIACGVIR